MKLEELRRESTLCDECGQTVHPGDECPLCADEFDSLTHLRCCPECPPEDNDG